MATQVTVEITKADAVRANLPAGVYEIKVDVAEWTDADRSRLAHEVGQAGVRGLYGVSAPTAEAVLAWVQKRVAAVAEAEAAAKREAAEREAAEAAKAAREAAEAAALLALDDAALLECADRGNPPVWVFTAQRYAQVPLSGYPALCDRIMTLMAARKARNEAEAAQKAAEKEAADAKKTAENRVVFEHVCSEEQRARLAAGYMPTRELRKTVSDEVWARVGGAEVMSPIKDEHVVAQHPAHGSSCEYSPDGEHDWDVVVDDATELTDVAFARFQELRSVLTARRLDEELPTAPWTVEVRPVMLQARCNRRSCPVEWHAVQAFEVVVASPAGIVRKRSIF
jgi:hypothetical protein